MIAYYIPHLIRLSNKIDYTITSVYCPAYYFKQRNETKNKNKKNIQILHVDK